MERISIMAVVNKYGSLKIGIFFSIVSLCSTITYIIPIISVIPGVIVEKLVSDCINNEPYSNVGKLTILVFSLMLILLLILSMHHISKVVKKKRFLERETVIITMLILSPIVHSLGFYIYWGTVLNYRGDGQLIFSAVNSFPVSSLVFITIGALIDLTKSRAIKRLSVL